MIWFLLACASPEENDTGDPCLHLHYNNFGAAFIQQYCLGCHANASSNNHNTPNNIHLETQDNIVEYRAVIIEAIENETMPPQGGVDLEIRQTALLWLECLGES